MSATGYPHSAIFDEALQQFTREAANVGDRLQQLIDQVLITQVRDTNTDMGRVLSVQRLDALHALATARDLVWAATSHLSAKGRCVRVPDTRPLLDERRAG